MSWNINRVILIGRLTKEPELSTTQTGKGIMKLYLAVNGRENKASFFKVIAWGDIGKNIGQYLHKGSLIGIDGHLESSSYKPKDSEKMVYETFVTADKIEMLETKKKENPSDGFYAPDADNAEINF